MAMPSIEMKVKLFRDEKDQARSQYALLTLMEALVRVNQSLIRHYQRGHEKGMFKAPLPRLYRSGVHYEREPPGQEHWPDILTILETTNGKYPGAWGDCEDLACWRVAELREAKWHYDRKGRKVKGGLKAKPYAKWRKGSQGQYNYHALVLLPDGRIEDPSLTLGMRREAQFAKQNIAAKLKAGKLNPKIYYVNAPDVIVVDPSKPDGYGTHSDKKKVMQKIDPDGLLKPSFVKRKKRGTDPNELLKPSFDAIHKKDLNSLASPSWSSGCVLGSDNVISESPAEDPRHLSNTQRIERLENTVLPSKKLPYPLEFAKRSVKSEFIRILKNVMSQV